MSAINIDLLKKLCLAFGPSGNEDEVRDIIIEEIKDYADDYFTDKVGNLVVFKKGEKTPEKKRMFAAHMDEVGFMVTSVDGDGYIKVKTVGGIETAVILGKQAIVGEKRFPAVFGGKPVHLLKGDEWAKARNMDAMYLDIGVTKAEKDKDKEDKEKGEENKNNKEDKEKKKDEPKPVDVGEFAVFKSEFYQFGENDGLIKTKAIDDRFGCYILIEMIKSSLAFDTYFAFTICEEIGLRGAHTVGNVVKPDIAVIIEATTAGDIYDKKQKNKVCSLGDGAVIPMRDNSTIHDKKLVALAFETAAKHSIKAQPKQIIAGGTDAGAIQLSGKGVAVLGISLPTRYLHSPSVVGNINDMSECLKLALEMEKII